MAPRCIETSKLGSMVSKTLSEVDITGKECRAIKDLEITSYEETISKKKEQNDDRTADENPKKEIVHCYPKISQVISYAPSVLPRKELVFRRQPYPTNKYFALPLSNKRSKSGRLRLCTDKPVPCAHCKKKIESKYLLYALDRYWHEKCFKCDFCRKPLHKFGNNFYCRQGAKFCQDDFVR